MAFRGILGWRGRRADRRANERNVENEYEQAIKAAGQPTAMEEEALATWRQDPMEAVRATNQAQLNTLLPQLDTALGQYRQGQVGRTQTGWARGGEDQIVQSGVNSLMNNTLAQSLWAAGQRNENAGNIYQHGQGMRNHRLGLAQQRMDGVTEARNNRSAMTTGLLTTGAGLVGTALAGPLGGMAGNAIARAFTPRLTPGPRPTMAGYRSPEMGLDLNGQVVRRRRA